MSKPIHPVSLSILGKEYKIACAVDEEDALLRSAKQLDTHMRKIRDTGKVISSDRIAVLAALNMANDSDTKSPTPEPDLCDRLRNLRLKIENVLENP
jgi:cell division protein ZapA